ncbi:flagellar biosynthesis anti-sigma factor FlgM [Clostridium sp. C8-1-8]|jgi:flagellar biosynthesis anti-sigma factor FlgM|uniref:flagellar biosynthesis anti-sigma factor FlgM n=1 Tax=Clostridium sp. C8-1-8 TaxID=2698831 RepID=UPI0013694D7A|nr:flagellar biosynthesis anti-sigma factor FlgM [Clostridium sp. C8-1-8]
MNIKGVGSTRNVIDIYHNNKVKTAQKAESVKQDSIEISGAAKALSSFSLGDDVMPRSEKVEALRMQVANGTYKPNNDLTAKAMIDSIREGRV